MAKHPSTPRKRRGALKKRFCKSRDSDNVWMKTRQWKTDPVDRSLHLTNRIAHLEGTSHRIHSILGDGNCMFRALSDQLFGDQKRHLALRQLIVQELTTNSARYEAFSPDEGTSWEMYLAEMAKPKIWGNNFELAAFANMTGFRLTVHHPEGKIRLDKEGDERADLHVVLFHKHYDSVIPGPEWVPVFPDGVVGERCPEGGREFLGRVEAAMELSLAKSELKIR